MINNIFTYSLYIVLSKHTLQVYSCLGRFLKCQGLAYQAAHPSWIPVIDSGCVWKGIVVIHLDMWIFFRLSSFLQHHWWPCAINPDNKSYHLFTNYCKLNEACSFHLIGSSFIENYSNIYCVQSREWNRILF